MGRRPRRAPRRAIELHQPSPAGCLSSMGLLVLGLFLFPVVVLLSVFGARKGDK